MASETGAQKARCVHCREEVSISDRYAHGDHIKCGACGTKHKVVRGDRLRLVIADATPLRDTLGQNQQLVTRLEGELSRARTSFGIGVNGILIGVIFGLYQVGMKGAPLSASLFANAAGGDGPGRARFRLPARHPRRAARDRQQVRPLRRDRRSCRFGARRDC